MPPTLLQTSQLTSKSVVRDISYCIRFCSRAATAGFRVPRQAQTPSGAFQDGAFRSGVKGGRRLKRKPEIGEHIHIIDVGVVRRAVGVEIAVHIAVREPLRGHVVKMVGGLQTPPCAEHAGIAVALTAFSKR